MLVKKYYNYKNTLISFLGYVCTIGSKNLTHFLNATNCHVLKSFCPRMNVKDREAIEQIWVFQTFGHLILERADVHGDELD